MIPPINEIKNRLVIKRYPRQLDCTIALENGDTYSLNHEELELVLKLLKVPDELNVLDYLWNFYAVQLDLTRMKMQSLSMEQAETLTGRKDPVVF